MGTKKQKPERLAKNFHRTFIPERQYLGELLKYAADGGEYEIQKIAEAIGIPTGDSSGKSIPTADYCRGMGLVSLVMPATKDSKPTLALTPFGRTVFLEDKFFKEPFTQWLAHLHLCNEWRGADPWFYLFCEGMKVLGMTFSYEAAKNLFLGNVIEDSTKREKGKTSFEKRFYNAFSPTWRMYSDDASFGLCGALQEKGNDYVRRTAPIRKEFAVGYAAWLAECMELAGRGNGQVSVDELEAQAGFRRISGWSQSEAQDVLDLLERKRLIEVDRHMRPWLVRFLQPSSTLWNHLFEDFL